MPIHNFWLYLAEVKTSLSSIRDLYYDDLSELLYAIGQGEDKTTGYVLAYRGTELVMEWAFPDRAMHFLQGDRFGAIYIVPFERVEVSERFSLGVLPFIYSVLSIRGTDPNVTYLLEDTGVMPFLYTYDGGDYVYYFEEDQREAQPSGVIEEAARSDDGTWHQTTLFRDGQIVSQNQVLPFHMNSSGGFFYPTRQVIYGWSPIVADGDKIEGVFPIFSFDEEHQIITHGTLDFRTIGHAPPYLNYVFDPSIDALYGLTNDNNVFYVIREGEPTGRVLSASPADKDSEP